MFCESLLIVIIMMNLYVHTCGKPVDPQQNQDRMECGYYHCDRTYQYCNRGFIDPECSRCADICSPFIVGQLKIAIERCEQICPVYWAKQKSQLASTAKPDTKHDESPGRAECTTYTFQIAISVIGTVIIILGLSCVVICCLIPLWRYSRKDECTSTTDLEKIINAMSPGDENIQGVRTSTQTALCSDNLNESSEILSLINSHGGLKQQPNRNSGSSGSGPLSDASVSSILSAAANVASESRDGAMNQVQTTDYSISYHKPEPHSLPGHQPFPNPQAFHSWPGSCARGNLMEQPRYAIQAKTDTNGLQSDTRLVMLRFGQDHRGTGPDPIGGLRMGERVEAESEETFVKTAQVVPVADPDDADEVESSAETLNLLADGENKSISRDQELRSLLSKPGSSSYSSRQS